MDSQGFTATDGISLL